MNKFLWGIRRENSSIKNDSTRWECIAERMTKNYGKGGMSPWWPWYSSSSNELFGREIENWGDVEFLWEEMMKKEGADLAQKITDLALHTREIFSDDFFLSTQIVNP